jgi:hypothetical protein
MCYHFLKVVRFSHSTLVKASIFILEWDIPLGCIYTIMWQRPSNTTNIIGLCNLVLPVKFSLSYATNRPFIKWIPWLKDLTCIAILKTFVKEARLSYRYYSLFPSSPFAVVSSFVLWKSELNYISIFQGRRTYVCIFQRGSLLCVRKARPPIDPLRIKHSLLMIL